MHPETPPLDREAKAAARREKVVQAARTLFAEQGFHSTGIAQISKQSGVLVGQIYRDFANKEAIVAAIVERDLEEFLDPGEICCAHGPPGAPAVRAWIMRIVEGHEVADARLVSEILAETARNERGRRSSSRSTAAWRNRSPTHCACSRRTRRRRGGSRASRG